MRILFSFLLYILISAGTFLAEEEPYILLQNLPVKTGELVTFTISADTSGETPYIAWDFGDGTGLGRYKKSFKATHRFSKPGVYQIFARVQGKTIPLSVTQTVYIAPTNPLPSRSSTICLDTLRDYIWVVNTDNNSVSCIDSKQNKLLKEVRVGTHPRSLALDAHGAVWVATEDESKISIVSSSGDETDEIELPYGARPYGICFDPQKKFCYVTLQGAGKLLKIDANTREIKQSLDVGRTPRGIAINSGGTKIFVTQFISPENRGVVRMIKAENMQLEKEISLAYDETPDFEDKGRGVPNYISSISISPDGTQAWVPSKKDNTSRGLFRDGNELTFENTVRTIVSRIDLATEEELLAYRTDINDADMACAVEFSPYGNMAFVALQGNNKISMIDVATNARLGQLDSTGLAPQGLVLNPEGTRLYVHNFMSRSVCVFNTEDIILGNNYTPVIEATVGTVTSELLEPDVLLGKQIFYNAEDERMTFAGYISCASCHLDGGSDERVWDFTDRGEGLRNTHSLLGRRGTGMGNVHWTSNFDEIQDFENDIRNAFKGKGFLPDHVFNSNNISDPLGTPKAGLSPELDALAAYVSSLDKVHPSPFRNQDGSLTQEAISGKIIFSSLGCGNCHSGPDFTDRATGILHDVGTIQTSSGKRRDSTLTGFGTPTLKGIWETAPYLHDGSAPTLKDVLITRNQEGKHGNISGLSDKQINDLVAYLKQIDERETGLVTDMTKPAGNLNKAALSISPNPVSEIIEIQFDANEKVSGMLQIINSANGAVVLSGKVEGNSIIPVNVSSLHEGVYIVKFTGANTVLSRKIIIKR